MVSRISFQLAFIALLLAPVLADSLNAPAAEVEARRLKGGGGGKVLLKKAGRRGGRALDAANNVATIAGAVGDLVNQRDFEKDQLLEARRRIPVPPRVRPMYVTAPRTRPQYGNAPREFDDLLEARRSPGLLAQYRSPNIFGSIRRRPVGFRGARRDFDELEARRIMPRLSPLHPNFNKYMPRPFGARKAPRDFDEYELYERDFDEYDMYERDLDDYYLD